MLALAAAAERGRRRLPAVRGRRAAACAAAARGRTPAGLTPTAAWPATPTWTAADVRRAGRAPGRTGGAGTARALLAGGRRRAAALLGARRRARRPGLRRDARLRPRSACSGRCAGPLTDAAARRCRCPDGVTVRAFRPGADERPGWASTRGPSPTTPSRAGGPIDDLRLREAEPWFDPAGFLLAVDIADDRARLPLDQGAPGRRATEPGDRRGLRARRRPGRAPPRAGRGPDRRRPAAPAGAAA